MHSCAMLCGVTKMIRHVPWVSPRQRQHQHPLQNHRLLLLLRP